jgi:hypothetical protein
MEIVQDSEIIRLAQIEVPHAAYPAHIQTHIIIDSAVRGHTLQVKLSQITAAAGNNVQCFAHILANPFKKCKRPV